MKVTGNNIPTRLQQRLLARYGSWAVVTGASSGVGRELAIKLAQARFDLISIARSQDILARLAAELTEGYGIEVRVICVDLGLTSSIDRVVAETNDLDVGLLIAAAGFGTSGAFLDTSLAAELELLDVNCRAPLAMSLHFGRRFAKRGRGGIVLMGSIVGFQGTPYAAHYAATKAYIQTLAEALHVELSPLGVDVLAAAPGPVASGFAARAGMRMGAALKPEEIAVPILAALGRRTTVLPGFLSKLLVYSLLPLPRWGRVWMMGRVMKGMTEHQH